MTNHKLEVMREYERRQSVRDEGESPSWQPCEQHGRSSDGKGDWEQAEWGRDHRRMSDFAMMYPNRT